MEIFSHEVTGSVVANHWPDKLQNVHYESWMFFVKTIQNIFFFQSDVERPMALSWTILDFLNLKIWKVWNNFGNPSTEIRQRNCVDVWCHWK